MLYRKWLSCEQALAMKAPVREAEFALDDASALSLYDCLTPLIKEHRRFKLDIGKIRKIYSRADYHSKQKVEQLKADERAQNYPRVIKENGQLRARVTQLENELSIVEWYLDVLEQGIDTKEIIVEYTKLKKKHKRLQDTSAFKIKKLEQTLQRTREEFKKALEYVKKQQYEVVYPLMANIKDLERKKEEVSVENSQLKRSLRVFHSIIRLPQLCSLFHKAERKRLTEKQRASKDEEAKLALRQLKVDETNAGTFIDDLCS